MDNRFFDFETTPLGSLLAVPAAERFPHIKNIVAVPDSIHNMLASTTTGAYVRGLTKTYNLPLAYAPQVALQILMVATGNKKLSDLGSLLSSELKMANDKAYAIAREIETELFTPVMLDLNTFLATQKQPMKQPPLGTQNIINLKNQPTIPRPVPPKPLNPPSLPPKLG